VVASRLLPYHSLGMGKESMHTDSELPQVPFVRTRKPWLGLVGFLLALTPGFLLALNAVLQPG